MAKAAITASENENKKADKTCLITVVHGMGASDRVIKVFPAEHEKEKVWLDNTIGIERWEAIKRLLYNHAERGTRVPDPVPYHSDPKNLAVVTLKEEDIPLVKLAAGAFLEAPPLEERISEVITRAMANSPSALADRLNKLEGNISQLTSLVATLVNQNQAFNAKPKEGK